MLTINGNTSGTIELGAQDIALQLQQRHRRDDLHRHPDARSVRGGAGAGALPHRRRQPDQLRQQHQPNDLVLDLRRAALFGRAERHRHRGRRQRCTGHRGARRAGDQRGQHPRVQHGERQRAQRVGRRRRSCRAGAAGHAVDRRRARRADAGQHGRSQLLGGRRHRRRHDDLHRDGERDQRGLGGRPDIHADCRLQRRGGNDLHGQRPRSQRHRRRAVGQRDRHDQHHPDRRHRQRHRDDQRGHGGQRLRPEQRHVRKPGPFDSVVRPRHQRHGHAQQQRHRGRQRPTTSSSTPPTPTSMAPTASPTPSPRAG